MDAFEQAVASVSKEGLTQAVELYHGALLPDDPYYGLTFVTTASTCLPARG